MPVLVLSHRGHWLEPAEKNTLAAFERSFAGGFGTETDLRDLSGTIVISHDMPTGHEMTAADFLGLESAAELPLALNIKADGQAAAVRELIDTAEATRAFVFDMAVPDMLAYFAAGIPVYTRMSEVEREPAWLERSAGIWLDAFEGTWYDADLVASLLDSGKQVCVVSPELHGREHLPTWELLAPFAGASTFSVCTDVPLDAAEFFGVTQ